MHSRRLFLLCSAWLLSFSIVTSPMIAATPSPRVETGIIGGAKFTALVPAQWNKQLLLIAPGYRPETSPLIADLSLDQLAYRTLAEEGWLIAKTSYRHSGVIIADGLADLDTLRAHLEKTYGAPTRVLLEGESMGGLIVTLAAEREPGLYAGALAIGAALDMREADGAAGVSLLPKIPLLFLTNQSELAGPRGYVFSKSPRPHAELRPVLFRIARNGHVNVSQRERLAGIRALNLWLDHGRASLPAPPTGEEFADLTITPEAQASRVVLHAEEHRFDTRVTEIASAYGNVRLDAQPADFAALGILQFHYFALRVGDKTYRVRYARDFSEVKRGEWVAFPDADGFTWLSRNFENAAATAGLAIGSKLSVQRYENPE